MSFDFIGGGGGGGGQGPAGADGKTWLNGTGAPSNGTGTNGDFYIDTAADAYYGPKAAGSWSGTGPTSLIGPQGDPGVDGGAGIEIYSVQYARATPYTTTSATMVAIDDANFGIAITLAVGDEVHLNFSAPFAISSPGNLIGFDWLVDAPVADTLIGANLSAWAVAAFEFGNNGTDSNQQSAMGKWVATEAGVHTFKPRWRVSGGTTATLMTGTGNYTGLVEHRAIVQRA